MDERAKEKLNEYLELLDEISEKTDDERTAVALLQEISKDRRMMQIKQEREAKNSNAATFKQKRFMRRLGIDFPDDISMKEASALINEELERLNEAE